MDFTFDVLLVSKNRPALLEKCLDSIFIQKPIQLRKVIVLTQRKDAETIRLLSKQSSLRDVEYMVTDSFPRPGAARNKLISQSLADYCQFLDDDAYLPSNYYALLVERLSKTRVEVLGGPDRAPIDGNLFQKTFEYLLGNKLVTGSTYRRHSVKESNVRMASEYDLTLCNLWIRREIINKYELRFDENLKRCEENEFLKKAQKLGLNFIYDPKLYVYHLRREEFLSLLKIHFLSGFYRGIVSTEDLLQFKGLFAIPFTAGILILFTLMFNLKFLLFGVSLHFFFMLLLGIKAWFEVESSKVIYHTVKIVWSIHVGFSLGVVFGFIKGLRNYVR